MRRLRRMHEKLPSGGFGLKNITYIALLMKQSVIFPHDTTQCVFRQVSLELFV
jgi:hypothetical protein